MSKILERFKEFAKPSEEEQKRKQAERTVKILREKDLRAREKEAEQLAYEQARLEKARQKGRVRGLAPSLSEKVLGVIRGTPSTPSLHRRHGRPQPSGLQRAARSLEATFDMGDLGLGFRPKPKPQKRGSRQIVIKLEGGQRKTSHRKKKKKIVYDSLLGF